MASSTLNELSSSQEPATTEQFAGVMIETKLAV